MKPALIQLIHSLTIGEKRSFKLQCKRIDKSSAYLDLYEIIAQNPQFNSDEIKLKFIQKHSKSLLNSTAQYLQQILLDVIIKQRSLKDSEFKIYQLMMQSKVYFERSLPYEGYKILNQVKSLADQTENHLFQYYAIRQKLNHLSRTGFENTSNFELHQLQTLSKNKLQLLRQIQEHHSLYELLKYRLIFSEKAQSKEQQKKLNDLILSELSLITRGKEKHFESQKLHLLFQSFFFTHSGDYKSGLKIFKQLTQLFENHQSLLEDPPYDYLDTLEGILESLRILEQFQEMEYYIDKISALQLHTKNHHFEALCQQIIVNAKLIILLHQKDYQIALSFILECAQKEADRTALQSLQKIEWQLYAIQVFCQLQKWDDAMEHIHQLDIDPKFALIPFKTAQLIKILIYYEQNNLTLIDYAKRNYQRITRNSKFKFQLEKLLFTVLKFDPHRKSRPNKLQFFEKIKPKLVQINQDVYERQLQQYFSFSDWIKHKLTP